MSLLLKLQLITLSVILVLVAAESGAINATDNELELSITDRRPSCRDASSATATSTRVDSTSRLLQLRTAMSTVKIVLGDPLKAYIITSDDEHQSEMLSAHDRRLEFITGFTGSAGIAVVTDKSAAFWTDGRYFLQAEQQLDCNWMIMKSGYDQVPTIPEWIASNLAVGDRIGADPKLVGADVWLDWSNDLADSGIRLDAIQTNLIDTIWNETNGRPRWTHQPILIHELKYAGESWENKVRAVRTELSALGVDSIIITALDEIAWLLNLRGSDIPFTPVFKSYVFISKKKAVLFIYRVLTTSAIRKHLHSDCHDEETCVEIREYDRTFNDLPGLMANVSTVLLPSKYAYSGGVSFAIHKTVEAHKRRAAPSPLILMKAQKNDIEVSGMKEAHLRDAVALCQFMSLLEDKIRAGEDWDELKVVKTLDAYRSKQPLNKGPSFNTIAGFGPNGAIIHYRPVKETSRKVDNTSMLLIDSGGQYLDGTTDVTRTLHFGRATQRQKELYTRVLMGSIDLAMLIFPENIDDARIDIIARQALYKAGVDYLHGTGHGIGSYLGVHEGPTQIRVHGKVGHLFEENYFFSDEPGFYKENEFGIRLENVLRVVHEPFKTVQEGEPYKRYFAFETITLVPYEPKLILPELMNNHQVKWLNNYNAKVRTKVGQELKSQNQMRAFHWLVSKTRHISSCRGSATVAAPSQSFSILTTFALFLVYISTRNQ